MKLKFDPLAAPLHNIKAPRIVRKQRCVVAYLCGLPDLISQGWHSCSSKCVCTNACYRSHEHLAVAATVTLCIPCTQSISRRFPLRRT